LIRHRVFAAHNHLCGTIEREVHATRRCTGQSRAALATLETTSTNSPKPSPRIVHESFVVHTQGGERALWHGRKERISYASCNSGRLRTHDAHGTQRRAYLLARHSSPSHNPPAEFAARLRREPELEREFARDDASMVHEFMVGELP
jgi:hypothetical protein